MPQLHPAPPPPTHKRTFRFLGTPGFRGRNTQLVECFFVVLCFHQDPSRTTCSNETSARKLGVPPPLFDLVMRPSKSMEQVLTICPVEDNESVMTFNPRNSYYAGGSKLPLHFSLNFRSHVLEIRI